MSRDIDTTVPNAARVYDYFLDGSHNFAADRELGDKIQQVLPAAPTGLSEVVQLYRNTPEPVYPRSREQVLRMFDGFELVEPGLVVSPLWRPSGPGDNCDSSEMNSLAYGAVGRKR